MGDDLDAIEADLRQGRMTPFPVWQPAVEHGARCQLLGFYPKELTATALGVDKPLARFMGRAAFMGLKAAQVALSRARLETRDLAVVVGSGTGEVATHRDIHTKLERTKNAKRLGLAHLLQQ